MSRESLRCVPITGIVIHKVPASVTSTARERLASREWVEVAGIGLGADQDGSFIHGESKNRGLRGVQCQLG